MNTPTRHADFDREQIKIEYAHDCLDAMVALYGGLPDAAAHPKVAHAFQELSKRILDRLGDDDPLCLGRIDPNDEAPLYIGRFGVHDGRQNVVLVNWQAPAAAPFWTATPADPDGIAAKRVFRTQGRQLLDIFEDRFDGAIADVPAVTAAGIDDLLLAELERDRGEQMRDIVATIRADQYRLMSAPLDELLIIQGAPGTGKTAVGLHRASWLLFNNRQLEASRVLVVGPNRVFMQYVAGVLPSLGEEAVDQSAIQYLSPAARARTEESPELARLKGDARMAIVIANEIWGRVKAPDEAPMLTIDGRLIQASAASVSAAIVSSQEGASTYMQARRAFVDRLRDAFFEAANETGRFGRARDDFAYVLNQTSAFRNVVERIWPRLSAAQAIRELLGSRDRLASAAEGVFEPEEAERLYRRNPDREADVRWTEHDLPLVDEAEELLNGSQETYGHLILDEAQDLTPMQLRMVGRRVRSSSITLLGDIAQATGVFAYSSWDEITEHLGRGRGHVEELLHAYRVPRQIMEFAAPVLHEIAPELSVPLPFREGNDPVVREIGRQFLGEEVVFEAQACAESGGSVGIIAPDSLLADVRAELDQQSVDYREASKGDLGGTVELLTPRMAKGLEFDHVVLVEPQAVLRESAAAAPLRELYVTLTRPTRSLVVLHAEALPGVLGGPVEKPPPVPPVVLDEAPVEVAPTPPAGPVLAEVAQLSPRISDALAYARLLGGRDPSTAKAVERGLAVAGLLFEAQADEEEAIAALIRPVVADDLEHAVADVRRLFGPKVAEALARSVNAPDESPIVFAEMLREALFGALANNDAEVVIDQLRQLAVSREE